MMKRNKITAIIMSIVMSMSLMMPSVVVLADEASAPSETQKTETVETKEPKAAEKQTPKETEKQEPKETEKQESKATETQETKETEKSEPETTETQESKESEKQESKETEKQAPAESKDNGDNPEESNETAVVEGNIPSQSVSTPKKNAVTGTCGDNLTWSLENGTLTISGSGEMMNFKRDSAPWRGYDIRNVVLPENITSIGDYAFQSCYSLMSVTIPNSVKRIGNYAFCEIQQIKSITIPDSVEVIGDYAFSWCSITSITIPDSVEIIGSHAFDRTKLTSVTIPDSVMSIGDYVFSECEYLQSIKLPKSVKKYGTGVLKECRNLTSIELPEGIKSIGEGEFHDFSKLKSVTIPDSVKIIGKSAFSSCSALTSVTIPKNVEYIGENAFSTSFNLTNVYYGNSEEKWKTIQIDSGNECLLKANIHYGAAYSITVNSGKTDLAKAAEGTKVTVTANAASSGKVFDKWIVDSGNVYLSNASSSTTTFTMPAENVEVTATYKDAEYTIKVNNGSATPATATAGTVIKLTADAAPSGKVFDKWVVDTGTVSLSNASSSTTTFTMPAGNVEVTATYKDVPAGSFVIKVNNGNGNTTSLISAPGLVVNVNANDAPAGTEFEKWEVVSGTVIFANASSVATIFVMPAENVEITARYKSSLSVKGKTATVKYSKVKKKNQTLSVSKVLTFVNKGQGKLTYAKVSGNSKISINKTTGTVTVKKKLKKKTYTVKVKVQASGNDSCNPSGWKTVTFKIKVK